MTGFVAAKQRRPALARQGHNYLAHNYLGHDCVRHDYMTAKQRRPSLARQGHNYLGHNYLGRDCVGHGYMTLRNSDGQHWLVKSNGDGGVTLQQKANHRFLDVDESTRTAGIGPWLDRP